MQPAANAREMKIEPLHLKIALANRPHVAPLKDGRVRSDRIEFDFLEFAKIPDAFRAMVRGGDIDVSEMAVCTHLQACHYGKDIVGLAVPLVAELPLSKLACATASEIGDAKSLEGRCVGVRSYTQTSGVWLRGMLDDGFGVDINGIKWLTSEAAHVAEYSDPAIAIASPSSESLMQRLLTGELSAALLAAHTDSADIRTVIPNAETQSQRWFESVGVIPINHTLSIRKSLLGRHDWLASELMYLFGQARLLALAEGAGLIPPYGFDATRTSLQCAFDFAARQALTPRAYRAEDFYLPF